MKNAGLMRIEISTSKRGTNGGIPVRIFDTELGRAADNR